VCSPTRAGLLTGRYQTRFGHEFNPGPPATAPKNFGLPLSETTLAELLRALGYSTGLVGKWHLGYLPDYHPQKRGFDEFFGFLAGAHSYIDPLADKNNPILRGTKEVEEKEYLTHAFTREAVSFIERHRKEPFFLMLTYNAVHAPMHVPPPDKLGKPKEQKRERLTAMLQAMDEGVGAVLSKLRELGLEEDTLIFFVSDNGGPTVQTTSRNNPLRGVKGQLWEGGVRVPFLIQWKGRIPAGKVFDDPVIALDILPTALAAAGGRPPEKNKLDGVNLLPHLTGKANGPPHEMLFWRFGNQWAIRKGNWKLAEVAGTLQLSDLKADIGESKDLSTTHPEVFKDLQAAYKKWDTEQAQPLWGPKGKALKKKAGKDEAADPATLLSVRGKLLFRDDLNEAPGKEWRVAKGKWEAAGGAVRVAELEDDMHAAVARHAMPFRDAIIQYDFKLDGGQATSLSVNTANGHLCRVLITAAGLTLKKDADRADKKAGVKGSVLETRKVAITPGAWHTVLIELRGNEMVASLDGKEVALAEHKALDVEKANFGLTVRGASVSFRNLRVWEALPNPFWPATRAKLMQSRAR
jgi:arylsulfatase A-like enzyme